MQDTTQPLVIISYQINRIHKLIGKIAFWVGIGAVGIVILIVALCLIRGVFPRLAIFYSLLDFLLGAILIVISRIYIKMIEWFTNRGQLVMHNNSIMVKRRNGSKEEVRTLTGYKSPLIPLLMLRAVTASGSKVNFRMSLLPEIRFMCL